MAQALATRSQLFKTIALMLFLPFSFLDALFKEVGPVISILFFAKISSLMALAPKSNYTVTCQLWGNSFVIRPFIPSDLALYVGAKVKEPYVQKIFKPQTGDVVVDAGAHIGFYTLTMAKKVGEKGKVIAVEPDPETYEILLQSVKANKFKNVIVVKAALTDCDGQRLFYSCKEPIFSGFYTVPSQTRVQRVIPVKTMKLDTLLAKLGVRKVDWIKIDVEGAEYEVLKGAEKTLRSNPDAQLIVETTNNDVGCFLHELGFSITNLSDFYCYAVRST